MSVINERRHTAEFMVSEAVSHRAREVKTVVGGDAPGLQAGTVLGELTSGGNFVILAPAASNGSEAAAGILWEAVTGTADRTVIVRDAEVVGTHLVWPEGISEGQKATAIGQLAALGIIVR